MASGLPVLQADEPGASPLPVATTDPSMVGDPGPEVSSSVEVVVDPIAPPAEFTVDALERGDFGLEPATLPMIRRTRTTPAMLYAIGCLRSRLTAPSISSDPVTEEKAISGRG